MTAHAVFTHSSKYGLTGPIVSGGSASPNLAWTNTGVNYVYLPPNLATYNIIDAIANPVIIMNYGGVSLHRVIETTTGAGSNLWEGDGTWHGSVYYKCTFDATHTNPATGYAWYYATYYDLGNVKSIVIDSDSPHDTMGMPGQGETGTLAFDVEGVVTTINVDGQLYESTPATMAAKITALRSLLNGNQYINLPCAFWWDRELVGGIAKPYFVSIKKFTFQGSEKDVSKVDYKLQMVVRATNV